LKKVLNIYCDEAGFTNGNYFDKTQPYFVYSAVSLSIEDLGFISTYLEVNFLKQKNFKEYKAKHFFNNTKGQDIILSLFDKYKDNLKLVYHEKLFVSCVKLIEYSIEPYLKNKFFFDSGLHLFLTGWLYSLVVKEDKIAIEFINDYLNILKGGSDFSVLLKYKNLSKEYEIILWLVDIILLDLDILKQDILNNGMKDKWILDTVITSLHALLNNWSTNNTELIVECDTMKIIQSEEWSRNLNMIGKKGIIKEGVGFSLKEPIKNGDSVKSIGIQFADIVSSTFFNCLKFPNSKFSNEIFDLFYSNNIILKECLTSSNLIDLTIVNREIYFEYMRVVYSELHKKHS
jgi:hypothetical protein